MRIVGDKNEHVHQKGEKNVQALQHGDWLTAVNGVKPVRTLKRTYSLENVQALRPGDWLTVVNGMKPVLTRKTTYSSEKKRYHLHLCLGLETGIEMANSKAKPNLTNPRCYLSIEPHRHCTPLTKVASSLPEDPDQIAKLAILLPLAPSERLDDVA